MRSHYGLDHLTTLTGMMIAMKLYLLLFNLFFLSFLTLPSLGFGQEEPPHQQSSMEQPSHPMLKDQDEGHEFYDFRETHEADSFQTKFINMLFLLALLIGFMILASWMLKRMMRSRLSQINTSSTIKVLETRNLSTRSTLYIIEAQGQCLLIAETHTAVTTLASLPSEEAEPHSTKPAKFI